MGTYKATNEDFVVAKVKGKEMAVLKKDAFERFNVSLLGLGDIRETSKPVETVAAVFDLAGFTNFCKQIDPHLSVPVFLSKFLDWLIVRLRDEMKKGEHPQGIELWAKPPMFIKFMGDGLLVLWDCTTSTNTTIRNIIVSCREICREFSKSFYPEIAKRLVEPPHELRCGIARGTSYSVGNGNDFVGSCINMAARIQKLPGITFGFNARGVDLDDEKRADFFKSNVMLTEVAIRGIGDYEKIGILRIEYEAMRRSDKKIYRVAGVGP